MVQKLFVIFAALNYWFYLSKAYIFACRLAPKSTAFWQSELSWLKRVRSWEYASCQSTPKLQLLPKQIILILQKQYLGQDFTVTNLISLFINLSSIFLILSSLICRWRLIKNPRFIHVFDASWFFCGIFYSFAVLILDCDRNDAKRVQELFLTGFSLCVYAKQLPQRCILFKKQQGQKTIKQNIIREAGVSWGCGQGQGDSCYHIGDAQQKTA